MDFESSAKPKLGWCGFANDSRTIDLASFRTARVKNGDNEEQGN